MEEKDWAEEFRQWREAKLLSQRMMGLAMGVTSKTISNIERGVAKPNRETRVKWKKLRERYSTGRRKVNLVEGEQP